MVASMQGHINPALQFAECIIRMGVHFKRNGSKALTDLIVATANKQCIVYTMLLHWVASVARDLHIPSTLLWIQPAMVLYIYYHYYNGFANFFNSSTIKIRKPLVTKILAYRCSSFFRENDKLGHFLHSVTQCIYRVCHLLFATHDLPSFLLASNHYAFVHHILQAQLEALENERNPRVLVNTFDALELKAFKALKKLNLVAIGPLVPNAIFGGRYPCNGSNNYIEWLNSKSKSLVICISFGSLLVLNKQQMEEIAHGLLDCGRPFLGKEEENLSCREELEQMGMIVPCLVYGVPMVTFPHWFDQATNAKLIKDVWKTRVRVTVNKNGIVEGDEIKRCLELVMGDGERGKAIRRNAKK
ncbi:hypothetical protein ACB094_02G040000 [Castanea mollissima]